MELISLPQHRTKCFDVCPLVVGEYRLSNPQGRPLWCGLPKTVVVEQPGAGANKSYVTTLGQGDTQLQPQAHQGPVGAGFWPWRIL